MTTLWLPCLQNNRLSVSWIKQETHTMYNFKRENKWGWTKHHTPNPISDSRCGFQWFHQGLFHSRRWWSNRVRFCIPSLPCSLGLQDRPQWRQMIQTVSNGDRWYIGAEIPNREEWVWCPWNTGWLQVEYYWIQKLNKEDYGFNKYWVLVYSCCCKTFPPSLLSDVVYTDLGSCHEIVGH